MNQELETMIDQHGLKCVLEAIREICYAEANLIAVEYQDVAQAKLWIAHALRVNQAAMGVRL